MTYKSMPFFNEIFSYFTTKSNNLSSFRSYLQGKRTVIRMLGECSEAQKNFQSPIFHVNDLNKPCKTAKHCSGIQYFQQ